MAFRDYNETSNYEEAASAIRAALAVSTVAQSMTTGDSEDRWASSIVEDLQTAELHLLKNVQGSISAMRHELWVANALLGKFGEEARAQAEKGAAQNLAEKV